ncbi:arginine--tRNA ligase [Peptoniphilus sp. KCTC 25270]|uniref:arginine--tRNA ligase n=1 Tax=Peptoniphilus sp. KCTC 25270 TaxID=2897414 RepID=UPI001E50D140|nr:arginine--tRNA ligase [Peptoniphilus sp. KCTC 25270]MCD1147986.1 arginine--tRNA ligase [Peptoniphilus sp. KCTC 25270]
MLDFKKIIAEKLHEEVPELEVDQFLSLIEIPPDSKMGDYAFPTFSLAKIKRKSPQMIAEEIKESLGDLESFEKIEVVGSYLNFFVDRKALAELMLGQVKEEKEEFGRTNYGENRPVVVEYSSPNIAKPFHIGHIRTTVIGDSLKRIYEFLGYDVTSINHLGDYGTQFGMMIEAYKLWGNREVIESNPIPELVKLYVRINQEAEEKPELLDNSREWFRKLEEKDEEAVALWKWFREVSLDEFQRVYKLLDIEFDSYRGESYYSDLMPAVVQEMEDKGVLVESDGAKIVDLEEYKLPPSIIVKRDGSTIYLTRDITAAKFRKDTYDFYKNIYVVGSQQNLHFQQLVAILDKMGYEWSKDCIHVPFGMVSLEDGTLSTRRGKVLYLEDVLNRAISQVDEILSKREEELGVVMENRKELAEQVGIGAVKFQELFNQRIKDYVFDWEKTLSFEGETGPYVQYTHARINSLLAKGNFQLDNKVNPALLTNEEEIRLLQLLYGFADIIVDAHLKNEPYFITRYIVEAAKTFNKFYNATTILTEEEELTNTRLLLCYGVKNMIKRGLDLLGIQAPEKM